LIYDLYVKISGRVKQNLSAYCTYAGAFVVLPCKLVMQFLCVQWFSHEGLLASLAATNGYAASFAVA